MAMRTQRQQRQTGTTLVEFALVLPIFLLVIFAVMELSRALYLLTMLQAVTARAASAASVADFSSTATMDAVRKNAVFDDVSGRLALGDPVTDAHVRIDYLSITRSAGGSMTLTAIPAGSFPASPAQNRLNCIKDPYGADCIRMVRVRICDPADTGTCNGVAYRPILPLVNLSFQLPKAATLVAAETLGFVPGTGP